MKSPSESERDWIGWCHRDQPSAHGVAAQQAVARMVEGSPYGQPIVSAEVREGQSVARGYAVACEGAIGYLGRLRFQGDASLEPTLLTRLVAELCDSTLDRGVEMVQAVLPADAIGPAESQFRVAFQRAGMIQAARLLQFECCDIPFQHDGAPLALAFAPIEMRPYRDMPRDRWCRLVESTYIDTLDVPILNGVRSVEQTLRGYAVGQSKAHLAWWSIHVGEDPVGCLILSSLFGRDCELTYLGLIPSARGRRYSPEIMDFVSDWMLNHGKTRIVLAVDENNAPALHLYHSFGFEALQVVEAWIASRRSSQSPKSRL